MCFVFVYIVSDAWELIFPFSGPLPWTQTILHMVLSQWIVYNTVYSQLYGHEVMAKMNDNNSNSHSDDDDDDDENNND